MPASPLPNILSAITFLPLVGAVILMLLPRPADIDEAHPASREDPARTMVTAVAVGFAALDLLLSIAAFANFHSGYVNPLTRNMQFVENARWISFGSLTIHYKMGIDGVSLLLILLTTFLMTLCVLYSCGMKTRLKEFMVFLLLLETGMVGVFCALDLVLFYVFWEAMLVPMYFLIGIFGHENRVYAAIKFFLYTFAGSVLMLVAIVAVYHTTGSLDVVALSVHSHGPGQILSGANARGLMWMYSAFALAFMIKVPMFPFHTWLPDAHVEAPTAGSVILAGVLLKMGTYGFIRFCLPMFPQQAAISAPLFITLAIVGIIYGSLVAAVQPDAKKLVAYSSVAHLGFVVLGIFTFTQIGMMGALVQNINHGISTGMLFFLVGILYERRHTRLIAEFGGLKRIIPMFATLMLIATLASIAVPFFNGFVGEFPILLGSWISARTGYLPTALAASGMIWSAVYMLWWFQRLMLGPVTKQENRAVKDLTRTEWLVLAPLAAVIFWFGLGSPFWTRRMVTSVATLIPAAAQQVDSDLPISSALLLGEAPALPNGPRLGGSHAMPIRGGKRQRVPPPGSLRMQGGGGGPAPAAPAAGGVPAQGGPNGTPSGGGSP